MAPEKPETDFATLQGAAAVVTAMGFHHYQMSKDTRIPMEARKAHRFVAMNAETCALNILKLSSLPEAELNEVLKSIMKQTVDFYRAQGKA